MGFWQVIVRRESVKLGGNLEDINNFAEVQRIPMYHSSREFSEVSILLEREVNEMKKISWKDFLVGVLATTIVFILLGAATTDDGPGRYAVSVGGGGGITTVFVLPIHILARQGVNKAADRKSILFRQIFN